jgi:hypothetical protein
MMKLTLMLELLITGDSGHRNPVYRTVAAAAKR